MGYNVEILADSVSPAGKRLTAFELTYPRFVHAEFLTHRMFCIAGDARLEFELPSGSKGGLHRRVYPMTISEFVDKWLNGANRTKSKPKGDFDFSWVEENGFYTAREVADRMGMASPSNIRTLCRSGEIKARKDGDWIICSAEIIKWRLRKPASRFDISDRLKSMRIRQLNEDTGDIVTSTVKNVCESGVKDVYEAIVGKKKVAATLDHLFLTESGWKRLGDIEIGEKVAVSSIKKMEDEKPDSTRHRKIGGRWRSVWQSKMRQHLQGQSALCRKCKERDGVDIHHIKPVYLFPDMAFVESNITLLCDVCHRREHEKQGWQRGNPLRCLFEPLESLVFRSSEMTYDLEIDGDYANFLANGFVVHNSRNAASSRAIPVEKMIQRVMDDPAMPVHWGKNQKGMQAEEELSWAGRMDSEFTWLEARDQAVESAQKLLDIGVHKQIANRLLEPWMWITVICSATEYENFFKLRCHKDAQPEIKYLADMMQEQYRTNEPNCVEYGEWHLPLLSKEEKDCLSEIDAIKVSVGRCARVSYLTHSGKRDIMADIDLHDRLLSSGHFSPFEHIATPAQNANAPIGNFFGWCQYRKMLANENYTGESS